MKIHLLTWLSATLLLAVPALASAQEAVKSGVDYILFSTPNGGDSLVQDVVFVESDSLHLLHERMLYQEDDKIAVLYPSEAKEVVRRNKKYVSVDVERTPGKSERLFMLSSLVEPVYGLKLYKLIDAKGNENRYMQAEGGALKPYSKQANATDALRAFLLGQNQKEGGNAQIASYITRMKARENTVENCCEIINEQNPRRIPRLRWGISAGVLFEHSQITSQSISSEMVNYHVTWEKTTSLHPAFAVYADYRFANGLSIHPELTFEQTSCNVETNANTHDELKAERMSVSMPLLVRYTYLNMQGRFLPYAEAGVSLNYTLKNENTSSIAQRDGSGHTLSYSTNTYTQTPGLYYRPMCGVGVEYELTPQRSLYLNLRYLFDVERECGNRILLKNGAFLTSLSIDLF